MADTRTDLRIPVSPIHGMVNTVGDNSSHGPFCQLLNPSGSGVDVFIYELKIGLLQAVGTSRVRARRTDTELTMAGTTVVGSKFHRDERDVTAILATLQAANSVVQTAHTEALSFWFDRINSSANNTYLEYELLKPGCFPLIISPGSALEVVLEQGGNNNTTNELRIYPVWDEIAQ